MAMQGGSEGCSCRTEAKLPKSAGSKALCTWVRRSPRAASPLPGAVNSRLATGECCHSLRAVASTSSAAEDSWEDTRLRRGGGDGSPPRAWPCGTAAESVAGCSGLLKCSRWAATSGNDSPHLRHVGCPMAGVSDMATERRGGRCSISAPHTVGASGCWLAGDLQGAAVMRA